MEPMRGPIEEMAAHFSRIAKGKEKIVVKYDTDGDGLSGALILYRMFEKLGKKDVIYVQSPSPVYRVEDGLRDAQDYGEAHFIFVDGENNNDSEDGLSIVRKGAKSVSIIDHHLSTRKKAPGEMVVTPIWHGLGYEYTSGFLCFEVARKVCEADYDILWKASLYCDKSTLKFELTSEVEEVGLVLDYISTIMDHEKHSMKFIDGLIGNKRMTHMEYLTAKDAVDTATALALSITRVSTLENGMLLVLVEVGRIVESGEFPPRGKITGRVHDAVIERKENGEKAIVTIGYTSDSVMLRANARALKMGFNGNEIINGFKKEMGNVVISGGGHAGAAAMKFNRGYEKVVLDAFARKIASLHG
jgi:RecJ-like exonuclease